MTTTKATTRRAVDDSGFAYYEVLLNDVTIGEVWRLDRQMEDMKWAGTRTVTSDHPLGTTQEWFATRDDAVSWLANWAPEVTP